MKFASVFQTCLLASLLLVNGGVLGKPTSPFLSLLKRSAEYGHDTDGVKLSKEECKLITNYDPIKDECYGSYCDQDRLVHFHYKNCKKVQSESPHTVQQSESQDAPHNPQHNSANTKPHESHNKVPHESTNEARNSPNETPKNPPVDDNPTNTIDESHHDSKESDMQTHETKSERGSIIPETRSKEFRRKMNNRKFQSNIKQLMKLKSHKKGTKNHQINSHYPDDIQTHQTTTPAHGVSNQKSESFPGAPIRGCFHVGVHHSPNTLIVVVNNRQSHTCFSVWCNANGDVEKRHDCKTQLDESDPENITPPPGVNIPDDITLEPTSGDVVTGDIDHAKRGCHFEGGYYEPNTKVGEGFDEELGWCWIVHCNANGEVIHIDDSNCSGKSPYHEDELH